MLRPARVRLILLASALLVGAVAGGYLLWPPDGDGPAPQDPGPAPPPDPRLTFDTPFRNVRPDVEYVGDAACCACHRDVCDTFHRHAMGRSARVPTDRPDGVEKFDPKARPRFTAAGHEYAVERAGDTLVQTETVRGPDGKPAAVTAVPVVAAIGSGTRGRSYLTARDGSLWQTGVSWFSEKQLWDTSPGFVPGRHGQRPVPPGCLFCHVDRVEHVSGTANRYREPLFGKQAHIGCERCHGPGALHVAEQAAGRAAAGPDTSIVNPRHLPADLRADVCRQCHFQGAGRVPRRGRGEFDFRPGLPLDLFITVVVRHPALTDYHKSVGQVEQLAVSRCATGSGGKLGCTSCHDPHQSPPPAEEEAYYRQRCQACHAEKGCTEPPPARQAVRDACTVCHMPKAASANIAHTAVTDHRIVRRPAPGKEAAGTLPAGALPIGVAAWHGARGPAEDEVARDLGIALAARARPGEAAVLADAVGRLRAAVGRHPDDLEAWEALAQALFAQGEWSEALRAAEAAVAAGPDREVALAAAAEAALRAHRLDQARDYARRAVAANPGNPENRLRLAQALIAAEQWVEAEAELAVLLKQSPNHALGRATLAVALHQQGKVREALAELDRAVAVDPRQGPAVREWFRSRTR